MIDKFLTTAFVIYVVIKTPRAVARFARYANTKQFCTRPADEYIAIAAKLSLVIFLTGILTAVVLGGISAIACLFSLI